MLKCGQKNNKNYTFGLNDKQIKEAGLKEIEEHKMCLACKTFITSKSKFCPSCGEKL